MGKAQFDATVIVGCLASEFNDGALLWWFDMAWAVPEFSRNQVDKAGFTLVDSSASPADLAWAFNVVNNWRSSHSYPLNSFQINLRRKIQRIKRQVLVAQRIKRLDSIKAKIERDQTHTIQLSQMQDIGGCRAVLPSNKDVERIVRAFRESRFAHRLRGEKDYISNPKPDGYRCHHLIYQYFSRQGQVASYDKLRIEIQLRTAHQHAWATALEAVGIFTRQALKANRGHDDWLRFFALTSSAIAAIEHCPLVPGTPTSSKELVEEIRHLSQKLNVRGTLEAYGKTISRTSGVASNVAKYYLVYLSLQNNNIRITRYGASQSELANEQYLETERQVQEGSGDQVVLVSVDSINALKRAYPNYFSDTRRFNDLLTSILAADDPNSWANIS